MTAKIGADGLDLFGDAWPELLADVVRLEPEPGGKWVNIEDQPGRRKGLRSTQRLWISHVAGGVAVATWPAELAGQARYLYRGGLSERLIAAALDLRWEVEASPHIAYRTSPPSRRLYMLPQPFIAPCEYAALWEGQEGFRHIGGNYSREDVEHDLWPWLKRSGLANDGDDTELLRFLDQSLRSWPANMRPGLRFRRIWTTAEVAELGSALAETIRHEFDTVFASAHERSLSSVEIVGRQP
jgi:hypothetical protein